MRQKFIVGNWKMHTTAVEAGRLAAAIVDGVGNEDLVSVTICPPFPCVALVAISRLCRGEQVVKRGGRVVVNPSGRMPTKTGAAAIGRF